MSFNDEQPKSGAARRLSQVEAKVKQGFATIKDVVIGEACNNCAKSTCNKIEHQYFCSVKCYHEFNHKREACARGSPLCCLPGCQKPCYYDLGRHCYLDFCGRTHGQKFKQEHKDHTQLYEIVKTHGGGGHFQLHSSTRPMHGAYHQSGRNFTYGPHGIASASGVHTRTSPSMCATDQPIFFYHSWQPYFQFTNFAPYPIRVAGKQWPTSEHFFQAQKFVGTPLVEKIRNCPTPREAFDVSRSELGTKWLRKDWSEEKENVMKLALRAKFTQHQFLHELLLSTDDRKLVEHTDKDNFWGDGGGHGRGQNKLGLMLMELRQELKHNQLRISFVDAQGTWEAAQGTFQGTPLYQATGKQVHPSHSETRSQAPQLHGNHGVQQGNSYTEDFQQRQLLYSEAVKK